jgi:hypothetical protein
MLASKSKPAAPATLQDATVQSTGGSARPTLRSVSPDYAEALDVEARLNADIASAEAEIQRLVKVERVTFEDKKSGIRVVEYGTINDGRIAFPAPPPMPEPAEHDSRIVSLLGRLTPKKVKHEPPAPRFDAERNSAAALSDQIDVAREALRVLAPVLHRLRAEASVELCRQIRPLYGPLAARLCHAQAELARAIIQHDEFTTDLRRQGAAFSHLRPCLTQGPNDLGDPIESIRSVLEWARIHGHYDGEVPTRSK